jgi:short-subunit dehydrogenase
MTDLNGKRIWIVGASFGIGEALAKELINKEAFVILSARNEEKLFHLSNLLGSSSYAVACDVTNYASIVSAYEKVMAAFGGIDMVIYNAGAYEPMSSASFDLEQVETMIDTNLRGAIRVIHTILPEMQKNDAGSIALVGSIAGYRGLPKAMGYGLSKAALIHLSENLRQDLEGTGVGIHIINPGFVTTRLTEKNHFPMPCIITPEKAAQHIVKGLEMGNYEIHFPKLLTYFMKAVAVLPAPIYFYLSKRFL